MTDQELKEIEERANDQSPRFITNGDYRLANGHRLQLCAEVRRLKSKHAKIAVSLDILIKQLHLAFEDAGGDVGIETAIDISIQALGYLREKSGELEKEGGQQ